MYAGIRGTEAEIRKQRQRYAKAYRTKNPQRHGHVHTLMNQKLLRYDYTSFVGSGVPKIYDDTAEVQQRIAQQLNAGEYFDIMIELWASSGAEEKQHRLVWLRENARGHAPLLLELGMAEMASLLRAYKSQGDDGALTKQDIADQYVKSKSLFKLATIIASAAGARTTDSSLKHYDGVLYDVYYEYMKGLVGKNGIFGKDEVVPEALQEVQAETLRDMIVEIQAFIIGDMALPSPTWLLSHGMSSIAAKFGLFKSEDKEVPSDESVIKVFKDAQKLLQGMLEDKEGLSAASRDAEMPVPTHSVGTGQSTVSTFSEDIQEGASPTGASSEEKVGGNSLPSFG